MHQDKLPTISSMKTPHNSFSSDISLLSLIVRTKIRKLRYEQELPLRIAELWKCEKLLQIVPNKRTKFLNAQHCNKVSSLLLHLEPKICKQFYEECEETIPITDAVA